MANLSLLLIDLCFKDGVDMPSTWSTIESVRDLISPTDFVLLTKYRARCKYVRGLSTANIEGLGEKVSDGYFVMLKLSLAFSAIEMIATVTNRRNNLGIRSSSVLRAMKSGKFDKLLKAIDRDNDRRYPKSISNEYGRWRDVSSNGDLTRFVAQCRNFMVHGSFSPSESGFSDSKLLRSLILELAEETIVAGDKALELWCLKLKQTKN
jgi:hypothetical protein